MRITVRLFATLRSGRFNEEIREYSPGTTVVQVAGDLHISAEELALILVNGVSARPEKPLNEGDVLALFPPVGGG